MKGLSKNFGARGFSTVLRLPFNTRVTREMVRQVQETILPRLLLLGRDGLPWR